MQPGCIPPPAVTQDGDLQFDGGGKQAGLRPLPLPQPQGFSSPVLGRGVCRVGVGPCVGGGPLLPSVIGGKGVRRPWRWQLPRAWLSDASGFGAAPGAVFRHGSWKRFLRRRDSRAAYGPTSNSTAFCPSLPHEFGHGRGLKRPNPLGLKCDTITSPRRLVNTFIHQMITDLLKRQTYNGGEQL
jgi:hypothetical protein